MTKVIVRSVFDAFEYVMDRYVPFGLEEFAPEGTYAVISIQDTHTEGFGFRFCESYACKAVLTLYFDDIIREVDGCVLFQKEQAEEIIRFTEKIKDIDTLLIHCYAGMSRSQAVGKFISELPGFESEEESIGYNEYVYDLLKKTYEKAA